MRLGLTSRKNETPKETPRPRPASTKVLYPRFEFEEDDPSFAAYLNPRLRARTEFHTWLPEVEVSALMNPQAVVYKEQTKNVRGHWWGVYHNAQRNLTLGRLYLSPFLGTTNLYRSWHIRHDHLWDSQGADGNDMEVVLERLRLDEPSFEEVMAVLISNPLWRRQEGQRVVMKNDAGQWAEPRFNEDYPERDFNFAVLIGLATRAGLEAVVPKK